MLIFFLLLFLFSSEVVTVGNGENKGSGGKLDFKAFSKRKKKRKNAFIFVTYHIFFQLKIRSMVIWGLLYLEVRMM